MHDKIFANESRWRNWRIFSPGENFYTYGTSALISDGAANMPEVVVTPKQKGGALVHDPATSVSAATSNGQGDPASKPCTCTF